MPTVRVSPKFQVVIPLDIRESLRIHPGETIRVLRYGNRIELIPFRKIRRMRGFLKGIDTTIQRDKDRV